MLLSGNRNRTVSCELHGILSDVRDDLNETILIGIHVKQRRKLDDEPVANVFGHFMQLTDNVLNG